MSRPKETKNAKESIDKAFLSIYKDHDISEISVSEVCLKAGVKRGVFYYHYSNIYDLLDKKTKEFVEHHRQSAYKAWLAYRNRDNSYHEAVDVSFDYVYSQKDFLSLRLGRRPDWPFINEWRLSIMSQLKRIFAGEEANLYVAASAIIAYYRFCLMNNIPRQEVDAEFFLHTIVAILSFPTEKTSRDSEKSD